jgi:tetratricopeptide (TPR) repeat protein
MPNRQAARHRRWQATVILTLFFLAVAGAAAVGWWYARESPPHQGPIVIIATDGLPVGALPPYGGTAAVTPGIDALAADSVVFEHAYSHSAQVLPAHASLISGQLPIEHGVRDDAGFVLKDDVRTLPELLRNRGFSTGAAVESTFLRRESGVGQGFAFFTASPDPSAEDGSGSVVDAAERWARTQSNQRYFLLLEVDEAEAESAVARITQLLKERKLYDDATIVFVGERGKGGAGGALDDPTLHVPLLIKQPANEAAGRRVIAPVQQIDLLPTLLDFVRAPVPGGLRGRSLRTVIDSGTGLPAQPIYSESLAGYYRFGGTPLYALTDDKYRYVRAGEDQMLLLDGGDPPDHAAESLRAALDRVVGNARPAAPAPIAPADEERLELAGYLPGLPPARVDDLTLDSVEQEAVADAHRAAASLAGERMFSAAITMLQSIVRVHPKLASVHYQIGLLLARSGRVDEAVGPFRTAAEFRPDTIDVSLALTDTLMRAGRYEDAQAAVDRAIAVASEVGGSVEADAHALAARLALARKDRDAAMEHADAARASNPGLPMPQFLRGRIAYDEGDYDVALTAFREAAAVTREQHTTIPDLHLFIGETLAHFEQYGEAETEYREELNTFPHNLQAYAGLAMLYRAANRDAELEDVLTELVDVAPTPEGYATAARLWTVLGERSRAEALRSDARARFRGDPSLALLGRETRR